MAQVSQPTQFINYVSEFKKILVTRQNKPISVKFKIDNRIDDTYYFQQINANNQIVDLSGFNYQFLGSYIDAKQYEHVLFFSDDFTITNNILSFKVNTYTSEYVNYVKVPKQIDITIRKKAEGLEQVILRDTGFAYPTPVHQGEGPGPVVAGFGLEKNGYVMSLTRSVLSGDGTTIAINDNVISFIGEVGDTYIGGTDIQITSDNVINFTGTIPTSASQLVNDVPYVTSSDSNFIVSTMTAGDWPRLKFNGSGQYDYLKLSWFPNDMNYTTWNSVQDMLELCGYLTAVPSTYAQTSAIPSAFSELTNDVGYINKLEGYNGISVHPNEGDPNIPPSSLWTIQINDTVLANMLQSDYGFATTGQIPTSASQLTNDTSNKIRYNQDIEWHDNTWALGYDPTVDIYHTKNRCNSAGKIRIRPMSGYTLNVGQGFVVQQWMYVDNTNLETEDPLEFYIDEYDENNIQLIGDWPDTVENHKVYAFVRRVIRQDQSNYVEHISFTSLIPNNN